MDEGCEAVAYRPTLADRIKWAGERLRRWVRGRLFRAAMAMVEDNNYLRHARREFLAAGYDLDEKDGPDRWIQDGLLDLLRVMSMQGHSGFSASYLTGAFEKLSRFEPITPLKGDESEWIEVGPQVFQNCRLSSVFKEKDGRAYRYDGRVFREPDGCCFTNGDSRVYIEFPYTPTREYVDVPKAAE